MKPVIFQSLGMMRDTSLAEAKVCAAVELMANGKKDDPSGILVAKAWLALLPVYFSPLIFIVEELI